MKTQSLINPRSKPSPRAHTIRPDLANAIAYMVHNAATQKEAAIYAGMHYASLCRALARPHVAEYLEAQKARANIDIPKMMEEARADAIREGRRLMKESKSDAVRAKMVDLFMHERAAPSVIVNNVNANKGLDEPKPVEQGVYHITRPDSVSSGDNVQDADIVDE